MIVDLHVHSRASDDSRAPVEGYLRWLVRRRDRLPVDGIVLTEHRQWQADLDYRPLEDRFGLLVLRGAEVETDYGHMLVFGVTADLAARFDFADPRLPAQAFVHVAAASGAVVVPCHPGRPTVGLCAHYERKPPLEGIVVVEALNGGSRPGEDERVRALVERHGYHACGGSDAHLVSMVGTCATEVDCVVRSMGDLVAALRAGRCRPVDFRSAPTAAPA